MRRVPATARLQVLVYSKVLVVPCSAVERRIPAVLCSAVKRRQARCLGREWARVGVAVGIAERAEQPLEVLRRRSCGYSLLARLGVWPLRGLRELVSPGCTSGRPGLAIVGSQSRVP